MNFPQVKPYSKLIVKEYVKPETIPKPKITLPEPSSEGIVVDPCMRDILQPSHVTMILGRPGAGKTHLLSELLTREEFYAKKYNRILYITPSKIPGVEHDETINTNTSLDIGWLIEKIKECSQWCQNMLVVLDDVVSSIPGQHNNQLQQLVYNRRHILPFGSVSFIITTQKYTCVPRWLRDCLTCFIAFTVQPAQCRNIALELHINKPARVLQEYFGVLEPHQFYLFNLETGKMYNHLFEPV